MAGCPMLADRRLVDPKLSDIIEWHAGPGKCAPRRHSSIGDGSQRPPVKRAALIFGHRPKSQQHVSAANGALATACQARGLHGKKPGSIVGERWIS